MVTSAEFLRCPQCRSPVRPMEKDRGLTCTRCGSGFPERNGVLEFLVRDDEEAKAYERYYEGFFKKEDPYDLKSSPIISFPLGHRAKIEIVRGMLREFEDKRRLVLLDIGCGESPEAFTNLERNENTIVYADISREALARARKKLEANEAFEKIFLASNEAVPVAEGTIDVIFAGEVVEHVKDPGKFLDHSSRLLKRDGAMIITTPNSNALTYRLVGRRFGAHEQHVSLQSYASMRGLLEGQFVIVEVKGVNQGIIGYRPDRVFNVSARFCAFWATVFSDRPQWATGLIFKCRRE